MNSSMTTVRFQLGEYRDVEDLVDITKALLTMPDVVAGLNGQLAKAMKPGSVSTGGLAGKALQREKDAAKTRIVELQGDFRERFNDHVQNWRDSVDRYHSIYAKSPDAAKEYLAQQEKKLLYRARRDIRIAYRDMFEQGKRSAGNLLSMDTSEGKLLERLRRDEFLYLRNFMADIRHGSGKMDYGERANLYGNAAGEAAWAGFVAGDLSHDRWLKWVWSPESEHCVDCEKLSKAGRWKDGIYSANELMRMGVFPGSGKLTCTTRCNCRLEETKLRRKFKESGPIKPFETAERKPSIRPHLERQKPRYKHKWAGRVK